MKLPYRTSGISTIIGIFRFNEPVGRRQREQPQFEPSWNWFLGLVDYGRADGDFVRRKIDMSHTVANISFGRQIVQGLKVCTPVKLRSAVHCDACRRHLLNSRTPINPEGMKNSVEIAGQAGGITAIVAPPIESIPNRRVLTAA